MSTKESIRQQIEQRNFDMFDRVFLEFFQNPQQFDEMKDAIQIDRLFEDIEDEGQRQSFIALTSSIRENIQSTHFVEWLSMIPMNKDEKDRIWRKVDRVDILGEDEEIDWKRMKDAHFEVQEYDVYTRIYHSIKRAFIEQCIETATIFIYLSQSGQKLDVSQ